MQISNKDESPNAKERGRWEENKTKNHGQDMPDRKKQVTLVPRIAHC